MPNFFIIGAPKCGTTALACYLAQHPNVFFSDPKEPHHYNTDLSYGLYKSRRKYLRLFESMEEQHTAVGEGSIWYLYSKEAVPNILKENPAAKFIAMLRNPVEMAPSLHEQMVYSGFENELDFEKAWALQDERREGRRVPLFCSEPRFLLYRDACSNGEHLERLLRVIPDGNLLPIIFDDFKADPRAVWCNVLNFLDVPDDGRMEFPIINSAKKRRSLLLKKLNDLYLMMRTLFRFEGFGTGVFSRLDDWNYNTRVRPPLSPAFEVTLKQEFIDDIGRLECLLKLDLSGWKK